MIDISNLVGLYLKTNTSIVKNKYKLYLKNMLHINVFKLKVRERERERECNRSMEINIQHN